MAEEVVVAVDGITVVAEIADQVAAAVALSVDVLPSKEETWGSSS